jgi:hypothetical protein
MSEEELAWMKRVGKAVRAAKLTQVNGPVTLWNWMFGD